MQSRLPPSTRSYCEQLVDEHRFLVLSIELLQRSVAVEVDCTAVVTA